MTGDAVLRAVLHLHAENGELGCCQECRATYPCATVRLIRDNGGPE